jgi:hypothetical protein
MPSPRVVAFLSTGRCGTQWLADALGERYPGRLAVEHEPLGPLYRPRAYFRCYTDPDRMLDVAEVREHVARIERESFYVETGWPLFAALPLFAQRFPEGLRVVHLTRHPVPTALSHLAHNSYAGSPRDDAYTRLATLGPADPNVFHPEYAERWDQLSPYEKCLFWCTEVSLYGLELPERLPHVAFMRVKSEDVLGGDRAELERLLDFVGVPWDDGWIAQTERMVDRWHHHTDRDVDALEVLSHPAAVAAGERLGYDVGAIDAAALNARYRGEPDAGDDRVGRFAS